ncbi:MAG: anti-sigma factor domain-containing protein [Acidimicrobiia bacterium]
MTCEEARAAMLSGSDLEAVEPHLATCRSCRVERPLWNKLRNTLADPNVWEEPPPDLASRIVGSLQARENEEGTRRWPLVPLVGVAAALLVLIGGVMVTMDLRTADWEIQLVATPEAPEARATIRGWATAQGTRMVIDISGIEDAPFGSYYEIWLTALDGRHVSAGTFNGPGQVTAFAGVRRADYPRIWITLESADQDLGPSGETYLDTT